MCMYYMHMLHMHMQHVHVHVHVHVVVTCVVGKVMCIKLQGLTS